jgi:hypothetical protein
LSDVGYIYEIFEFCGRLYTDERFGRGESKVSLLTNEMISELKQDGPGYPAPYVSERARALLPLHLRPAPLGSKTSVRLV